MLHMQLKRRTNRAILSAMLLSLVLAAEAVPAQAAGRAELAMERRSLPAQLLRCRRGLLRRSL